MSSENSNGEPEANSEEDRMSDSDIRLENGGLVPVEISSESSKNGEEDDVDSANGSKMSIAQKYQEFLNAKRMETLTVDDPRVKNLPSPLQKPVQDLIKTIAKLSSRNPAGSSFSALEVLCERLSQFLDLQDRRNDPDYEAECREILTVIYQNIIEAQRLARRLQEAATPRPLDEYE